MPQEEVLVSLVVATLGRDEPLRRLLDSMAPVDPGLIEVIVVDQNADDRVTRVLAAAAVDARHVRVPWAHASRARNLGAGLARGRWVAFPDDDCWALAGTGTGLVAALASAEARGADLVTGRILDEHGDPHMRRWPTASREFGVADLRDCAIEATTVLRREEFLAVGGFDVRFGPGARFAAAEGDELLVRLARRPGGWAGWFDVGFALGHPRRVAGGNRASVVRTWRYSIGAGAAWGRHPFSVLARSTSWAVVESCGALLLRAPRPFLVADRLARAAGIVVGFLRGVLTLHGPVASRRARAGERRDLIGADVATATGPVTGSGNEAR